MALASLFIKHRINTNHMSASGPVKDAADITIEDFVPTDTEKNYILNLQLQFELWGKEQYLVTSSQGRVELRRGPVPREKLSEIETVKKKLCYYFQKLKCLGQHQHLLHLLPGSPNQRGRLACW